jgi:tRNA wybutosine-synthesizing protein 2
MEPWMRNEIDELLSSLPDRLKQRLPRKYEKIGDILIIHLHPSLYSWKEEIGQAYRKVFRVKTVLLKGRIQGEFRVPRFIPIAGSDTTTIHKENGIFFALDLSKVMFSSGNIHERIRMSHLPHHEMVVDMFAGIGYFTLPIAKFCESTVHAVEKNVDAFHFLCENIAINGVGHRVRAYLMDSNHFQGKAQRVIMGHPQAYLFLDTAFTIVDHGFIHYHAFVPEKRMERPINRLEAAAEKAGKHLEITDARKIKKFSPGVWHMVFDVQIVK